MRAVVLSAGLFAIASIFVACGPDPNARLPGSSKGSQTPDNGGSVPPPNGTGGATVTPSGTGGVSSPFDNGGAGGSSKPTGSGGASSKGGSGGSATGSGGAAQGGAGSGAGGSGGSQGGSGGPVDPKAEPCSPATDVSGNATHTLNSTSDVCLRTQDDISGTSWNCSSFAGWTLKVNGKPTECGTTLPAKANGFYYFNAIAGSGAQSWAAIYWYNAVEHPGPYPAWPGSSTPPTTPDAAIPPGPSVDSGGGPAVDTGN